MKQELKIPAYELLLKAVVYQFCKEKEENLQKPKRASPFYWSRPCDMFIA